MNIDPKLIRSSYLGKRMKEILDNKDETITSLSEKINSSRPSISNILNGKVVGSDNTYIKIGKAIGLSSKEIENIFKEADKEEYKYKYGEEISPNCDDIDFEVALKKEFGKEMDADTISKIKDFIKFVNQNEK